MKDGIDKMYSPLVLVIYIEYEDLSGAEIMTADPLTRLLGAEPVVGCIYQILFRISKTATVSGDIYTKMSSLSSVKSRRWLENDSLH